MIASPRPEELATRWDPDWLGSTYMALRGMELFAQGQALQEVWYVVSGIVKLTLSDARGVESIVGFTLAGEWLGTAPVIANTPTPLSAITCCRTALRRLPARAFRELLHQDGQLSLQIHQAHAKDLCRQATWIGQLGSLGSLRRLECALCRLAQTGHASTTGSAVKLQLPIHQWELAEFVGITPEYLSRLLKAMEQQDLIRRDKGWIIIRDQKSLCPDFDKPSG